MPLGSEQEQVRKFACAEPREPAAVINPPECQAPVAIEAVPAQIGDLESFAAHGLHGIPEDRLYVSDFHRHARSEPAQRQQLTGRGVYIQPSIQPIKTLAHFSPKVAAKATLG